MLNGYPLNNEYDIEVEITKMNEFLRFSFPIQFRYDENDSPLVKKYSKKTSLTFPTHPSFTTLMISVMTPPRSSGDGIIFWDPR